MDFCASKNSTSMANSFTKENENVKKKKKMKAEYKMNHQNVEISKILY